MVIDCCGCIADNVAATGHYLELSKEAKGVSWRGESSTLSVGMNLA